MRKMMRYFAVFGTLIVAAAAGSAGLAQNAPPDEDKASIWSLQGENASVSPGRITDRYYTNGLRLGWTSAPGAVPASVAGAGRALLGDGTQRFSVDITQQIYTPLATKLAMPPTGDRPYAGVLMAQAALVQDTASSRTQLGAGLGVMGPAAMGMQVQNGFHDLIGQAGNRGWGRQLANEPIIQLGASRVWRAGLGNPGSLQADILPNIAAGLGNLRSYAQVGATIRLGQGLDHDFGVPRLPPALSGGDAFAPADFAWYVFLGVDGKAVARDATLDGNSFTASASVQRTPFVGEVQAGLAVMAYGVRLTYSHVLQTQQFRGQKGGLHQLGSLALGVRF
jgi:lipid A 3-O-deacylase